MVCLWVWNGNRKCLNGLKYGYERLKQSNRPGKWLDAHFCVSYRIRDRAKTTPLDDRTASIASPSHA